MTDILQDIHQYSHNFTISQVVTFFERKGISLTRSMIQNYVRDGLLPSPVNKRHYTHKHLAVLALICGLKSVYEMTDIKTVIVPLIDGEGISLEVYKRYIDQAAQLSASLNPPNTLALMACSAGLKESVLRKLEVEA